VFAVRGDRLDLRQVIGSGGTFPVSIADRGDVVYVANALGGGSIQGFLLVGDHLISVPGWNRPLWLDPAATPQFVNTPGQIVFTPDGSSLIVTTKANGNDIDVFGIGAFGRPSAKPVVNPEPDTVPFGATFDRSGHLVIAEAGTNAVTTYSFGHHGRLTRIDSVGVGQKATCWVTRIGSTLYASNAGSGNLSDVAVDPSGWITHLGETGTDAGTVDAAPSADGRYLYVQAGAAGEVDEFSVARDGSLTLMGSVTVPGAVGGEGIAAL
jgi:DNA-binding beta-propeller fold protein YncE